ncbi:MAG: hypothetical protein AB7W59_30590 [Acidimicrobiia bacterium]
MGLRRLLMWSACVLLAVLPWGVPRVGAQSGDRLFGVLDEVVAPDPLRIMVRGWAVDPGDPETVVNITVQVRRPDGSGSTDAVGPADRLRHDVGLAVFPAIGGNDNAPCPRFCTARDFHGFAAVLTDQPAGPATVCVDASLGAVTTRVGCQDVRVAWPSLHDPVGAVTSVSVDMTAADPSVTVTGWAWDRDDLSQSLIVRAYALQYLPWASPYIGGDREPCLGDLFACLGGGIVPAGGKDTVADLPGPLGDGVAGHGFTKIVIDQDYEPYSPLPTTTPALERGVPTRVCAIAENIGPGRDHLLGCQWVQL